MVFQLKNALSRRLRFRLATTFALFGTLVSLLLSGIVFLAEQHGSDRLMDETLRSELQDYMARRARNPASMPPATISIRGYVFRPDAEPSDIPPQILTLHPGAHRLAMSGIVYRTRIEDQGDVRYVMLFNESQQRQRDKEFLLLLVLGTLGTALVSAALGWWLAWRLVAPVAKLAQLIGSTEPERAKLEATEFSDDEIGKLASGVFGEYVKRMHAFISREQAFTTDVSHELRTPLSIVRGVVELLERDPSLDERAHLRVDRIRRAVDGMIDTTSALLLMAREESMHQAPSAPCDVCRVVREAVDNHSHMLSPTTSVQLDCRSEPQLPVESTLLKIVIANLVLNAFTHTTRGNVGVVVDEQGVTVTDTGSGISEDDIKKIFQKHFKGPLSTGSGIGLSLVKRICDRYGWEIAIHSSVDQGTTAQLLYSGTKRLS
jgi:signal transduction histidine kinase